MATQQELAPADIIAQQLGGQRKLKLMVGAKDFFSDDNGNTLVFNFKSSKANYVRITLNSMDTYDVKFQKIGRLNKKTFEVPVKDVAEYNGIYHDQLMDIFEEVTGLYLTLNSRR